MRITKILWRVLCVEMKEESLKYGSNMFPFHCLHWKQDNYINALPCVLAVARSNFAAK